MFQMMVFFISTIEACNLIANKVKLYPTEGERYVWTLAKVFQNFFLNYSCIDCPENITLWNQVNTIYQNTSQYTAQSLSSNGSHFLTITTQSTINLYTYQNNEIFLSCLTQIEPHFQCFNSIFAQQNNILIDCYDSKNNILQFYLMSMCKSVVFQTIQNQTIPQKTKMMTFISEKKIYLLYAQFYKKYQLLTVFSYSKGQLVNQSTWTQGFQDFDVSNRFIYINYIGLLQQVYITQTSELFVQSVYNMTGIFIPISYIKVQTPIFYYSDYDMIYVAYYTGLNEFMLQLFKAQNGSIQETSVSNIFESGKWSSSVQILLSNTFLLFQIDNNIEIMQIGDYQLINVYNINANYSNLAFSYFNSLTNVLYQFSDRIEVFLIKQSQIEMYFQNQIQLHSFIIVGYNMENKEFNNTCSLIISPFILKENDRNVLLTFSTPQQFYFPQDSVFWYKILGFSGPLMKSSLIMLNQQLGMANDITFIPTNILFSYSFQVTGFQYIVEEGDEVFFAGSLNGDIYFYNCSNQNSCTLVYSDIRLENITQIRMIIYYQSTLLVGINQGINDIRIYYFNVSFNGSCSIIQFSNIVVYSFPAYKQFLFTYDNIIVLLQSQEIIIQSLTSSDQFTLGNEEIKTLFPNYDLKSIHFKPINIAMNEVYLSSILFINNQNSVIIVVIQSTYEIIPYCIMNVVFDIYQINIIVYQLIISYKCETLICFQVWNIMNLRKPDFVKNLPSISMIKGWNIVSDNLFLYVKSQVNTMYVFNPLLSYHSSLYYEFNFTGNYFSSIAIFEYSLFYMNNQFFILQIVMMQQFKLFTNFSCNYIQQTLFNVYVENKFFSNQSTPNKILSIINPLTEIQLPQNLVLNSAIHVPFTIILDPKSYSKQQSGQIISYNLNQNQKFCYLQNYIQFSSFDDFFYQQDIQPLWIFMIDKALIMQFYLNMSNYFYMKQTNYSNWQLIFIGYAFCLERTDLKHNLHLLNMLFQQFLVSYFILI